MSILHTLRKIRRCENEVAAQIVLEHAIAKAVQQTKEETRQHCADICFNADKSIHPTDLGERILNAGKTGESE